MELIVSFHIHTRRGKFLSILATTDFSKSNLTCDSLTLLLSPLVIADKEANTFVNCGVADGSKPCCLTRASISYYWVTAVIKQIDACLLAWQPVGINMAIDPHRWLPASLYKLHSAMVIVLLILS